MLYIGLLLIYSFSKGKALHQSWNEQFQSNAFAEETSGQRRPVISKGTSDQMKALGRMLLAQQTALAFSCISRGACFPQCSASSARLRYGIPDKRNRQIGFSPSLMSMTKRDTHQHSAKRRAILKHLPLVAAAGAAASRPFLAVAAAAPALDKNEQLVKDNEKALNDIIAQIKAEKNQGAAPKSEAKVQGEDAEQENVDLVSTIELLRKATTAKPDDLDAWRQLAEALIIQADAEMMQGVYAPVGLPKQRLDEALRAIDRADSLVEQPDAINLNFKGIIYIKLRLWKEARLAFADSVEVAPPEFELTPRLNEALVLFEQGLLGLAEPRVKEVLRRFPLSADAGLLLATLLFEQGDKEGGRTITAKLPDEMDLQEYAKIWPPRPAKALGYLLQDGVVRTYRNKARYGPR